MQPIEKPSKTSILQGASALFSLPGNDEAGLLFPSEIKRIKKIKHTVAILNILQMSVISLNCEAKHNNGDNAFLIVIQT